MKKAEPTPAKLSRDKLVAEAITLNIAGLSTREIAKRLGTSPATISRILTGKTKLPEATVATYATNTTQSRDVSPVRPHDTTTHSRDTIALRPQDPQSIIDHAQSAVIDIIKRIRDVTYGEEDVAKLATAADKLTGVAERIANITRLANQQQTEQAEQSANSTFMRDFAARHKA